MNRKMTVRWMSASVAALALGAGCNPSAHQIQTLQQKNEEQEKVVAGLVENMEALRLKVDGFERRQEALLSEAADKVIAERFGGSIQDAVDRQVAQQMNAQEGLDRLIVERVEEGIAAIEARKEAERVAAEQARAEEREQRRQEFMNQRWAEAAQQFNLNPTQTEQLRALAENARTEIRAAMEQMRESGGFDREAMREQGEAMRSRIESEMGAILTPEQLEAIRAQPMGLMRMMDLGPGGGRNPRRQE
ncbi:MAG: hypothetical protein KBA51_09350 [Kiritimatiellae bacterium]|nr:hypothetical protein [Kiritimatiellia bacterium]